MEKEIISLNSAENFTLLSGLAQPLDEKGWSRIYLTPRGRPKSIVFVFDSVGNRLLHELQPGVAISLWRSLKDEFIDGIKYKAYAISDQAKNCRFQATFTFGDVKIPDATLDLRISVSQSDDVAISVVEGGDPVKELCRSVKSHLDRVFTEIQFEDIDSLQQFAEGVHAYVHATRVEHPYLVLEQVTIQYNLPKSIEEAFGQIQEERIKRKTLAEKSQREYAEAEEKRRLERLRQEAQLELDELELERLGFTDASFRLLMRDPEKRTQYLDKLYDHRMALLKRSQEQDVELINMQLETIRKFRDRVLDESSSIEELQQLLKLVSRTRLSQPEGPVLSTVVQGEFPSVSQLKDRTAEESAPLLSDNAFQEPEEPASSEEEAEENRPEVLEPTKPKRSRRRPRASNGDEASDS